MRVGFTRGIHPVVTGRTGISNTDMIKVNLGPVRRHVTGITWLGGNNVRRAFTDGNDAVVTTFTGADDFRMIHDSHGYPADRGMTRLANVCCENMIRWLARGDRAFVARNTATQYFGMIHV